VDALSQQLAVAGIGGAEEDRDKLTQTAVRVTAQLAARLSGGHRASAICTPGADGL
jgi:hypothetical protein